MRLICTMLLLAASAGAQEYKLSPESQQRAEGVPKGAVTKHTWTSKIYPGTVRDYWVYVPSQYKPDRPAPLIVFQDGGGYVTEDGGWRAPIVLDNLIHRGEMPSAIGVFINPGVMPARNDKEQGRFNRSFEYDAVGDRYARFLLEEIIPEVGKQYKLSTDPNDRALVGSSSGGIAAFTAAWNRPDQFRRVISFIGSYVNLRGGHIYSSLVRKTEPKPLRVFLQDGSNDQNIYSGNWWIANQDLASALRYAGYDTTFIMGTEGHNSRHGGAILPYAMRWLWREYPKPIAKSTSTTGERHYVNLFLDPASEWEIVSQGHRAIDGLAVDKEGSLYFADTAANRIHKISPDGKTSLFKENSSGAAGLVFGPDGRLYAAQGTRKRIVAYSATGAESTFVDGVVAGDLAVTQKGEIYFADPAGKRVWFTDGKGAKRVVHEGMESVNGVQLSADQSLLLVSDSRNKWIWSFQVQPDGSLANGVPFYGLETPPENSQSGADGMSVDTEGHLYIATHHGVQICDQPGRVVAILNKPQSGPLTHMTFGGPDLQTLYVAAGDKIFKRRVKRTGVSPWAAVKPPQPRL